MNVMDPFTYDLLARPPPPCLFGAFSGGAALQTEERTELLNAYPRAIGVLPQLSPADFPPIHMYGTPSPPLKASVEPPASCELYNAALEAFVQPAIEDARERPSPDYLATTQVGQISPLKRAILVGWMDKFARHYDLAPGTLHRAVPYMDRFLSVRALASTCDYQLILLGAVAVFLAAKYEDQSTVRKLNANEIVRYGGFTTRQEVLHMESTMVAALGYQLGGPTAYTFVEHFTRYSQGEEDLQVQCLAHQLADQSLLHHGCLRFLPSAVAASAIFLGRLQTLISRPDVLVPPWNRELHELTGHKPMDLIDCVHSMYMLIPSPRFELLWVFFEDP